ncbi:uncharacterized protein LOC111050761 [Nilaparvata lugens]|uniref:uncharacterized protein LOC111050761 n=1 Tax=Nilaparvata lugens TaxID=108931 RepID=UPI00193CBFA4|nr:uncharacterized protein LOC111050761 [Nilaparvata lugens]
MWSKIIFYLAWFFYSVELSSAFFSRPQHQAITNNGASKTRVATTTVTGQQSTESQNIPTTAAVNQQQQQQHLPNYFSNHQTANVNQHSAIPSNLHGVPPVQPHS